MPKMFSNQSGLAMPIAVVAAAGLIAGMIAMVAGYLASTGQDASSLLNYSPPPIQTEINVPIQTGSVQEYSLGEKEIKGSTWMDNNRDSKKNNGEHPFPK